MGRLPSDRSTEDAVRDVLELARIHAGEWLGASEVARRLQRPEESVRVILSRLAEGYVLHSDGDRFRYDSDILLDLDVERFLHRSQQHTQFQQNNLAKFRDRFGSR
jgi:hypothetical protein